VVDTTSFSSQAADVRTLPFNKESDLTQNILVLPKASLTTISSDPFENMFDSIAETSKKEVEGTMDDTTSFLSLPADDHHLLTQKKEPTNTLLDFDDMASTVSLASNQLHPVLTPSTNPGATNLLDDIQEIADEYVADKLEVPEPLVETKSAQISQDLNESNIGFNGFEIKEPQIVAKDEPTSVNIEENLEDKVDMAEDNSNDDWGDNEWGDDFDASNDKAKGNFALKTEAASLELDLDVELDDVDLSNVDTTDLNLSDDFLSD